MRLTILVDVIAIAACIAIILAAVDRRSEHAAQNRAGNRALPDANARDDRTGNRTADCTGSGTTDDPTGLTIVTVGAWP